MTSAQTPVTARARFFREFDIKRRLDGAAALSLPMPLPVKMRVVFHLVVGEPGFLAIDMLLSHHQRARR